MKYARVAQSQNSIKINCKSSTHTDLWEDEFNPKQKLYHNVENTKFKIY